MAEREPGFYWVRPVNGDDWEIARWSGNYWLRFGDDDGYTDEYFAEIGERIERSGNLLRRYFTREQLEEALKYNWSQIGEATAPKFRFLIEDMDLSESETFHDVPARRTIDG